MVIHSSILVWRISWIEEFGGLKSTASHELDTTKQLRLLLHFNVNNSNIYFCLYFGMEVDLRKY